MRAQLKLADKTGFLSGPDISPVAFRAAQMLLFIAELENAERNRFNLKRSLLSTGQFDHNKMFPEYFSKEVNSEEEAEQAEDAGDHVSYDYSGVKWMTPNESKGDYEKLLDQMLKKGGGTVTGDQVAAATETDWV